MSIFLKEKRRTQPPDNPTTQRQSETRRARIRQCDTIAQRAHAFTRASDPVAQSPPFQAKAVRGDGMQPEQKTHILKRGGHKQRGGRNRKRKEGGERSEMPNAAALRKRLARDTSCTSTAGHAGSSRHNAGCTGRAGRAGESRSSPRPHFHSHTSGSSAQCAEELG